MQIAPNNCCCCCYYNNSQSIYYDNGNLKKQQANGRASQMYAVRSMCAMSRIPFQMFCSCKTYTHLYKHVLVFSQLFIFTQLSTRLRVIISFMGSGILFLFSSYPTLFHSFAISAVNIYILIYFEKCALFFSIFFVT